MVLVMLATVVLLLVPVTMLFFLVMARAPGAAVPAMPAMPAVPTISTPSMIFLATMSRLTSVAVFMRRIKLRL
jgi:hypothetical protein